MFQTSFDGGDISSITSGFDIDIKKPIVGILKTKRNSLKKKVHNFSLDSDDAVIEPLLQKVKETTETGNQSAKNILSKTKTDSKGDDKDKLLADKQSGMPSMTNIPIVTNSAHLVNGSNNVKVSIKSNGSTITQTHSHLNSYMFNNDARQNPPKTQALVGIESTKLSGYSPSPLIFTTAKIHTDGKSKQMEPVQVTPVPILSTIESNVVITGAVTNITTGVNETWRGDNEQNMQDNIFSKNQVSSAPLPRITSNISSDAVTKKSSGNKVIITSSTLMEVSQAPKVIDVKAIDVKSVPLTSDINVTQREVLKSEQSTETSITHIKETSKLAAFSENPKGALEKITPSMYNTKTGNSILTPNVCDINKTNNMIKVTEMDINKNIQSPKTITSQEPGTSNKIDSSSNTKTPEPSGIDRIIKQANCSLSDKKIQSKKYETAERCFEPDNKETASNLNKTDKTTSSKENDDYNLAPKSLSLKSSVTQSKAKSIIPSITTAVSSVVSPITCSESSQAQIVATISKTTAINKELPVSVVKSLTTNDIVKATASTDTNISNSEKNPSVASTHTTASVSAISKSLTVSSVKSPTVITTTQSSSTTKNMKISIANPLITSSPVTVAMSLKMTKTDANTTSISTTKSQSVAGIKSTCSVLPPQSKPLTDATTKIPVITPKSTTTVSQTSPKSTVTSVKSTAVPRMSQTSSTKTVTGSAISTVTKPSTVTTMKSSAGQKVNASKLVTPKSAAAVVSTSNTAKKVSNEQNDKKTSDGLSKGSKGSNA